MHTCWQNQKLFALLFFLFKNRLVFDIAGELLASGRADWTMVKVKQNHIVMQLQVSVHTCLFKKGYLSIGYADLLIGYADLVSGGMSQPLYLAPALSSLGVVICQALGIRTL